MLTARPPCLSVALQSNSTGVGFYVFKKHSVAAGYWAMQSLLPPVTSIDRSGFTASPAIDVGGKKRTSFVVSAFNREGILAVTSLTGLPPKVRPHALPASNPKGRRISSCQDAPFDCVEGTCVEP